jgi:hypothetical protein
MGVPETAAPASPCTTAVYRLRSKQQDAAVEKETKVASSVKMSTAGMFALMSFGVFAAGVVAAAVKSRRSTAIRQVDTARFTAQTDASAKSEKEPLPHTVESEVSAKTVYTEVLSEPPQPKAVEMGDWTQYPEELCDDRNLEETSASHMFFSRRLPPMPVCPPPVPPSKNGISSRGCPLRADPQPRTARLGSSTCLPAIAEVEEVAVVNNSGSCSEETNASEDNGAGISAFLNDDTPEEKEATQQSEGKLLCPSDGWEYVDPKQKVHGPFPLSLMKRWYFECYFTADLLMRCDPNDSFVKFEELFPASLSAFESYPNRPPEQEDAANPNQEVVSGRDQEAGAAELDVLSSQDIASQLHGKSMYRKAGDLVGLPPFRLVQVRGRRAVLLYPEEEKMQQLAREKQETDVASKSELAKRKAAGL